MSARRLMLILALLTVVVSKAFAVAPPMINYQGKLMQPSGAPVPDELLATCATAAGAGVDGGFCPGTGAELRVSTNYILADTLGQFVVGQSAAPDNSYSCAVIEHGFWHSDVWISSLAAMKQEPDYAYVDAYAKVVTAGTDQFSRNFYIADQSRLAGIRVSVGTNPIIVAEGDMVDVAGMLLTSNRERYIAYPEITVRFPDVIHLNPFFMPNWCVGGKGTDTLAPGGIGLNNLSQLVKASGRVTYVDTALPARFFYIDDGSGLLDGTVVGSQPLVGLRVTLIGLATGNEISPPDLDSYVAVTGISVPQSLSGGKVVAAIRPRTQEDIEVITYDH